MKKGNGNIEEGGNRARGRVLPYCPLSDFGVSIFPFGIVLESEDRSQEAEKVSSPETY